MKKKLPPFDDFGLRSPVIQKPFQTKTATSVVAHVFFFSHLQREKVKNKMSQSEERQWINQWTARSI